MSWWLKAHRASLLAAIIAALGALAWLAASGRVLGGSIASPVKAGSAVPLALWLPLGVVASLCWSCSVDDVLNARTVAVRADRLLLTGFVAATTATAIAALLPAAVTAPSITGGVARNIVGLIGIAMIVRPRLGSAGASAAVAGYLAVAALLGAGPSGGAAWWAWPVAQRLDPWGAVAASVLFAIGLAVTSGRLPGSRPGGWSVPCGSPRPAP